MLNLDFREGDDLYVGVKSAPYSTFKQVILHKVSGGVATFLTEEEAVDVEVSDKPCRVDIGMHGIRVSVKKSPIREDNYTLGLEAPQDILMLRGRKYRQMIDE